MRIERYKSRTYYFFDDMIKDLRYVKINSVNPLYLTINKINGYFKEINRNKYLTLVPTNESKDILKKYEELWYSIKDIIRSITNNSDNYDENQI